jgi:hypothetical protein
MDRPQGFYLKELHRLSHEVLLEGTQQFAANTAPVQGGRHSHEVYLR